MKFLLQTIEGKVTLDMCFQMERAKEYWDWRNPDDSFEIEYGRLDNFWFNDLNDLIKLGMFNPKEWCPVGTVEFVEKYLRTCFDDNVADMAIVPLNVPEAFLDNCRFDCGRYVRNEYINRDEEYPSDTFFFKDNIRIKNPSNGILTYKQVIEDNNLENVQVSSIIQDDHNSSEWRVFIHKGEAVDIKHYSGDPFVFPNMDTIINRYVPKLNFKEGTLDVYVDEIDCETYVLECHKFFSCGLYGFDQLDILPLMYWRTYKNLLNTYYEGTM